VLTNTRATPLLGKNHSTPQEVELLYLSMEKTEEHALKHEPRSENHRKF